MHAIPAQLTTPGVSSTPSRSACTCNQSSSRPTMSVHTGAIVVASSPASSRRRSPRSTASATASACGTVNDTVALMLTPAAVISSSAAIPARVTGAFTCMFGARPANRIACSVIRSGSR
jgi:hypothetical protein